ncbi:MAG: YerC/YecD family TrpR-related protein [Patescibacteria group bacterium]|nr:YerC/YecD family TrpR-related protein [Patescibacteria group bacterium]
MPGKMRYNQLSEFEKKKYLGEFYSMVSLLRGRDEVKKFFKDLLTLSEVVMISRRIQIAKMLLEGFDYEEIRKQLKVGKTTISHVEKWLNNGFGGYQEIIKRHNKKEAKRKIESLPAVPFSWQAIKKKYPLHFLLLNALDKNK